MLAHMVYFTLNDSSVEAQDQLVAACHELLKPHSGIEFFAAGKLVPDLDRPVNDREFHVALHVVFDSRESHDAYQVADKHNLFIDQNKGNWAKVRVFDSNV